MTARRAFALALTTLALAACGGGQRQEEPPPSAPEPSTPPAQTTPPEGGDTMTPGEGTTTPPEGGGTGTGEGTTTPPGAQGGMGGGVMCPSAISGTRMMVEDTVDGVAIRFTNPTQTDEVRRAAQHMAEMHDVRRVGGGPGAHHGHHGMGHQGMPMPPHTARVQNIENGAMLVFTPVAARDLDVLRSEARTLANRMETGDCPMMQGGGMNQPGVPMDEESLETEEVPGAGE